MVFLTAIMSAEGKVMHEAQPQLDIRTGDPTGFVVPAGKWGMVKSDIISLLRIAWVEGEEGLLALERLGAPEGKCQAAGYHGRRLIRVEYGFVVLNWFKYCLPDTTRVARDARYHLQERLKLKALRAGKARQILGVATTDGVKRDFDALGGGD